MIGDQRGAITVILLSLLPLLLTASAFLIGLFFLLRTHTNALHECRVSLLRAETVRLAKMESLFRLNPEATRLRRLREASDAALKAAAAAGPQAVAAARAARRIIIARQITLATKQRSLILSANARTRAQLYRLRTDLARIYTRDARIYGATGVSGATGEDDVNGINGAGDVNGVAQSLSGAGPADVSISALQEFRPLAVRAEQAKSLTPNYVTANGFERRQVMRVTWRFSPTRLLPSWMPLAGLSPGHLTMRGQCATTAARKPSGERKWHARLEADRPL